MAYVIAWMLYLCMALLLCAGYERYLAPLLKEQRQLRIFLRSCLWVLLFTPGVVAAGEQTFVVPACVGVMFNILARSGVGTMKAALPLLLVFTLVFSVLCFREVRRTEADA